MLAAGRDVLELNVTDLAGEPADRLGRIFANAVEMADVEVHRDGGRVEAALEAQILVASLDDQTRLGLDADHDPELLGQRG
jgi:hypothetical protein